jgi:hypothetical protein
MNQNLLAKAIAILLLGMLFASYTNHDQQKWRRLGRDAFVTHELARFDRFIARPQPFVVTAFAAFFVAGLLFGFYEFIVYVLSAVLKSSAPAQAGPPGGMNVPLS